MTVFDYAVIAVVTLSVLLGFWRGVVGEVLALAAWVLAFFAARYLAPFLSPVLAQWVAEPGLRVVLAWIFVVVSVLLLIALVRQVVKLLLKAVGLGWTDRTLGAFFGIARGALVVLFGVMVAGLTPLPKASWWREAMLSPPLETVVIAAKPWMPQELAKRIDYR
ncbi:MAG: CvpA family protein [Rhodocyclaceae bacterium]|jgi:membrane protein required for colicin V production|nr:CvpA family protein [Rhodocyclaceae bacterium]MBK6906868.1 CvpA family protein [Rhodocyclaceae bacterium]